MHDILQSGAWTALSARRDALLTTTLRDLFGSSKLYIDFGEHPGRDRIPREAAASAPTAAP